MRQSRKRKRVASWTGALYLGHTAQVVALQVVSRFSREVVRGPALVRVALVVLHDVLSRHGDGGQREAGGGGQGGHVHRRHLGLEAELVVGQLEGETGLGPLEGKTATHNVWTKTRKDGFLLVLLSPVMPWLFIWPILYSAFSEGSSAAPMVIPSIMALNFRTMGFFSRPSGSWGNSLASTGVWLMLDAFSEGCGVGVSSLFGGWLR